MNDGKGQAGRIHRCGFGYHYDNFGIGTSEAGNSAPPSELLAIAGVDSLDDATYEAAGELIGELIDEFIREVEGQRDKPQLVPLS